MPDDGTREEAAGGEQVDGEWSGDVSDLVAAVPLARAALAEITPESTIGEPLGHVVEGEGVVSLHFASSLAGYPGWHWTVTVGRADDDAQPTVLEAELMPGDDALLAPDWVPWSERLAEYQAAQEALAAETEEAGAEGDEEDDDAVDGDYDDDDDESDDDESDDEDESDDDHDIHDLHGDDDLDGVDIDSVDVGYDERTDVDSELDLASEEAAALADDEDAEESDTEDSADDESADDSAVAASAGDAEVGEAEQA
ncbi:hypothetical protein ASF88_04175 [Leifsonia sp. Leaf336]|uniref:DUF3027 domain-containing protein n=1 Tax=Leifsonia sp. Leaf336 TaxID=1736341 RepID=UPI0006F741D8|nr:DUF3027 domain-containing protein [Leifsonia sp. Leaf336]KQR54041.1 hypothetical protein ASF88_04175 [Leifsonia sp. Leaf336]